MLGPLTYGALAASASLANLTFTSDKAAITPAITLSAGAGAPAPAWRVTESDAQEYVYSTAEFNHTKTAAGNMTIVLENSAVIAPYVTQINLNNDGINSALAGLHVELFTSLTHLYLYSTGVTGDITAAAWPASLEVLLLYSTGVTGDVAAAAWPASLTHLYLNNTGVTGDVAAAAWPASLTHLYLYSTGVTGDITAAAWPASLEVLLLYSTGVSYSGAGQPLASLTKLDTFRIDSCALSQAAVDAILFDLYSGCVARTATNGTINAGGTNAAPSGTHQAAASCPVTSGTPGKETAHELVNNGCAVASFNAWATVTFTA